MTQHTNSRLVIHVSEAVEDVSRAIATAGALRESYPGIHIRIVVNGPALTAVPAIDTAEISTNVDVSVCAIGLQRRDIAQTEIPEGVEVVPAASVVIVEEQLNGAMYLRL